MPNHGSMTLPQPSQSVAPSNWPRPVWSRKMPHSRMRSAASMPASFNCCTTMRRPWLHEGRRDDVDGEGLAIRADKFACAGVQGVSLALDQLARLVQVELADRGDDVFDRIHGRAAWPDSRGR